MTLDVSALLGRLKSMSHEDMVATLSLLDELETRKRIALAQMDFLAFIAAVDPTYKFGSHLKRLGGLLMQIEQGSKDRIAVSMAPRMGKSLMISVYYPAWYLGKHPDHKVILASHTADLAVDMARKVRNLMQTDEYRRIFPGVSIAADAKAAGKWNTTKGGEVFAAGVGGALAGRGANLCVVPSTLVTTQERGLVRADTVCVGEHVLSWHGWAPVQAVMTPKHRATVTLAGKLAVSEEHPVWTFTRGWVPASEVQEEDLLWTISIWDKLATHLYGVRHAPHHSRPVPFARLQHLGHDAPTMPQSARGQLPRLRSAGYHCVRALGALRKFLRRYGRPAFRPAYAGPDRFERELHPCKLPLGRHGSAAEQPIQFREDHGVRRVVVGSAMGAANRVDPRHDPAPDFCNADAARGSADRPTYEPHQAGYYPVPAGWLRRAAIRILGRRRKSDKPRIGLRTSQESYLERLVRKGQDFAGLLLGVRRAGTVRIEHHPPKAFVNFMVGGDHTFIADSVLTHNCIVDDPLSEQDLKAGSTDSLDVVYEWFRSGLRTRLMPGGRLCLLHTRWHQRDLIGRVVKDAAMNPDADQYEVFEFPAILTTPNPDYDPEDPESPAEVQKSLWPEQWSLESLLRTKASMPAWQWNAQYMQTPTAQEAALIKRDDIRWWPKDTPPECDFVVQAWDTAMTTKDRSDYSVCQTWGVWTTEDGVNNVILLNSVRRKVEFPELKRIALEQVQEWEPDALIVEAKASGQPLIDELRRSGIYVQEFSPGKGQDKIARVNAVTDMFVSGQVWFPETHWATEVVEEIVAFPSGEHDDQVDAMTLALRRVRQGGLMRLTSDHEDNDLLPYRRRAAYY